jgi:hypothetical protein
MVLVWVVSTTGVVVAGTLTVGVYWFMLARSGPR